MSKAVIFDLDGTIYFGNKVAYYALDIIGALKKIGYLIIFFSNNSRETRQDICAKLSSMNINTNISKIYTSSYATCMYLKKNNIYNIFLIGTEGFRRELLSFDINIVDEKLCESVVVGLDFDFTYDTIAKAVAAIHNGANIIASNADKNFPSENGVKKPGANAILSSILGSLDNLNYKCDIVGKPNTYMLEIICNDWKLDKKDIFVVGDSLESDIAMADNFKCKSILVNEKNNLEKVLEIINRERL
jgi:HAD superfamily hydrolase (TIGR01450 family)